MHTYWGMPADPRNTLRYTVERTCAMLRVTGYWLHPPTKQVIFNSNQLAATAALCSLTTNPKESKLDLQYVWICQMTELYTVDNHTLLLYVVIIIITHVICVHIYITHRIIMIFHICLLVSLCLLHFVTIVAAIRFFCADTESAVQPCDPAQMGHRHCQHTARCFGIPSDAWGSSWKQLLYGTSWNRQFNPFQFISLLLHFSLRSCALSAHIPVEKEQGCHGGFHTNIRDLSNPKYQVTNERMSLEDSYTRWYEPVAAV